MSRNIERLKHLYKQSHKIAFKGREKIIFLSDLHMGNGKRRDDFAKNHLLVESILERHYLNKGFYLFLNGDVEELMKFPLFQIKNHYSQLYRIFDLFYEKQRLYKLVGNHDYKLLMPGHSLPYRHYSSLKLQYGSYPFFIYHGHQSSYAYNYLSNIMEFFIYYFARPFNIKNYSVAYNKEKSYAVERDSYQFARSQRIISIIGHSHRPLFESISQKDNLVIKLEKYLRLYRKSSPKEQVELASRIRMLGKKLHLQEEKDPNEPLSSLYSHGFVQPCLFNSGCAVGKRGITCIELQGGKIALVHWFDADSHPEKKDSPRSHIPDTMKGLPYYRKVLKEDSLQYIFDCIHLLE